ncbi:uncharacterized protein MAM_03971 [Metarhizium album ARSEF 1941]|uniref:Uncharacterized protein n=1 Tax=Metarhizium album (strain ARSEF 1941) TaxID=1081103 RepID=A0A0B2WZD1_METAS|nr:uncharacterized protein MAM_03971 [Metarhizium album ARSEF 1941]KHN98210.1 hypothetical protein MAM_03971 [Metarhizium album ARSEF 1941]
MSRSSSLNHRRGPAAIETIIIPDISKQTHLTDAENIASVGLQQYRRPMRRGTFLSRSPPDKKFSAVTGLRGLDVSEADATGIIPIGMALGSPSPERGSCGTRWQPQVTTTVTAGKGGSQDEQQTKDGLSRSKSRKWSIFGRSRSKRVKNSDRAMDSPDQVTTPSETPTRGTPTSAGFRGPGHTDFREANPSPKPKALGRSFTEPMASEPTWYPQVVSPPAKTQTATDGTRPRQREPIRKNINTFSGEPFLDVEIPNITLDRYSVMFASLLERRSATSLLARRQVTQDKIRALREEAAGPGHRSAVSRTRRKQSVDRDLPPIPSLRLEPLQATRKNRPKFHHRSNTSAGIMYTPSKETFTDSHARDGEQGKSSHIVRLASLKGREASIGSGISQQGHRPHLRSRFHIRSPTHKHSGSKSPTNSSFDLSDEYLEEGGLSPPPARGHSQRIVNSSQSKKCPPTLQQATTAPIPSTPAFQGSPSPSSPLGEELDEDEDKAVQDAVKISIARQISVSREQRRMLGPLQMHPTEGKRIAETKSSTPRLVDPRVDPSSPSAGCRKSEWVVLESV